MKKIVIVAFILLVSVNAQAFVTSVDFFGVDFRFNNPGARANGMGGAFIGLADDATAAYTNPAGLTILTQPEISVEYKYAKYTTVVFDETGKSEYDDTVDDVSFLSYVYPKDKATITVFRHKFLDIESNFLWHEPEMTQQIKMMINSTTLGAGLGFKLTDSFSMGLTVGFDTLNYKSYAESINRYGNIETVNDNDTATHYTVSMLWNPIGEFNVGLVYRQGPEYSTRKTRFEYDDEVGGTESYLLQYDHENTLKVPDVYGLGMSYRFLSSLTVAFDVNYIEYSDLLDGLITPPEDFNPDDPDNHAPYPEELDIDDEIEIHAGLEYIYDFNGMPLAARCGYYFRPDHRLQYTGSSANNAQILQEGDDDHIFSLGFGAVVSDSIQVDVSGSAGDLATEFTMSLVYRYN